jgi:hypothetical protein
VPSLIAVMGIQIGFIEPLRVLMDDFGVGPRGVAAAKGCLVSSTITLEAPPVKRVPGLRGS